MSRSSRPSFALARLVFVGVLLVVTSATATLASTSSSATNGKDTSDVSSSAALVADALGALHRLDRERPEWHHLGYRQTRALLAPPLASASSSSADPSTSSAGVSLFGMVDVQVPLDWIGWLSDLGGPLGSVADAETTRRALRAYVATAKDALRKLKAAWELDRNSDAGFTLAQLALFGNYSLPVAPRISFDLFQELAATTGNPSAHYFLGFFYATNLGGVLGAGDLARTTRQDLAQVHYSMATASSPPCVHFGAHMALGFRYLQGIGAPESCEKAYVMYYNVAREVLSYHLSGPPFGHRQPPVRVRLSDEDGGVYGAGSTYPPRARATGSGDLTEEDVFEYFKMRADQGSLKEQVQLGLTLYYGTSTIHHDFRRAFRYLSVAAQTDVAALKQLAEQGQWVLGSGGQTDEYRSTEEEFNAARSMVAQAAGMTGLMYLRGEAVAQSNSTAREWFRRGVTLEDPGSYTWLGIMELDALTLKASRNGGKLDATDILASNKYIAYVGKGAKAQKAEAQAYLGMYYYGIRKYTEAMQYLSLASSKGHLHATYRLAEMHIKGYGTTKSCSMAITYLKSVAERGMDWIDPLTTTAYNALVAGRNPDLALVLYLMAAERGVEVAQANVAWMLDQRFSSAAGGLPSVGDALSLVSRLAVDGAKAVTSLVLGSNTDPSTDLAAAAEKQSPPSSSSSPSLQWWTAYFPSNVVNVDQVALLQWIRAANQQNEDARVKVGDYYYHGLGTRQSYALAAAAYAAAAESQSSGIAMWSLGYMYQHGLGVPRDYHLAKRYYDQALTINVDAWVPVTVSLAHLHISNWREILFGRAQVESGSQQASSSVTAPQGKAEVAPPVPDSTAAPPAVGADDAPVIDDSDWSYRDLSRKDRGDAATGGTGGVDGTASAGSSSPWWTPVGLVVRLWRFATALLTAVVFGAVEGAISDESETLLLLVLAGILVALVRWRAARQEREQLALARATRGIGATDEPVELGIVANNFVVAPAAADNIAVDVAAELPQQAVPPSPAPAAAVASSFSGSSAFAAHVAPDGLRNRAAATGSATDHAHLPPLPLSSSDDDDSDGGAQALQEEREG